jgi:hypothetical protein
MRVLLPALLLAALPAAALEPRDINRDGVVDAYYDPATDTSWAAQVSYASSPFEAAIWAQDLKVFGFDDWHAPRITGGGCIETHPAPAPPECQAQMLDPSLPREDIFADVRYYWLDGIVDGYCFTSGGASQQCAFVVASAVALRAGDVVQAAGRMAVSAVPEPETYALMLAGLGALAWLGPRSRGARPRAA